MKRYKKYITPYLGAFLMGPHMMLTEVAGEVALPKLMSLIINNGVAGRDTGYILKTGLLMAAVVVCMAVGGILGSYFAAKASINFTTDLRRDIFKKVQQFSFANIDSFSTGSLVTRLTNDIQQVQKCTDHGLKNGPAGSWDVCGGIIYGIYDEWKAGGYPAGGDPPSFPGHRADPENGLPAV